MKSAKKHKWKLVTLKRQGERDRAVVMCPNCDQWRNNLNKNIQCPATFKKNQE